jgi:hypothetical protein
MSIYGIGNPVGANRPGGIGQGGRAAPADDRRAPATPPAPSALPAAATRLPGTVAPKGAAALPVAAPAGTDPALWSVLSAEERTFFAKVGSMGPLTYGRVLDQKSAAPAPSLPMHRGGRLDVKI